MKKSQGASEYLMISAVALIIVLMVILLVSSRPNEVSEQTKPQQYMTSVESLISKLKAQKDWDTIKTQTISCSEGQCEFNGETKSIDDATFTYSDTLENTYKRCIYENDLDSCKAIVYVLGD